MLNVLVLFSNPPDPKAARLRLDKEDKIITALARRYSDSVDVHRQHASETEDIHELLNDGCYDVIQFSGHGDPNGILLDKNDMDSCGELVSALRLQSLLEIPETPPTLVILLSCYSSDSLPILSQVAPFVISAFGPVTDSCSLDFIGGFYERLFAGYSIQNSVDHAVRVIKAKGRDCENIHLDRRFFIEREGSKYIESRPDPKKDSILVNLDKVGDSIASLGIPEEEVLHLISKKLTIHRWIFEIPRERCMIPIGRLLLGEFTWQNAKDVVHCDKLMKLRADVPFEHWDIWHKLLIAYNDLASNDYRILDNPAGEENRNGLLRAINLFAHYIEKHVSPSQERIVKLGLNEAIPYIVFVKTHCEVARDQFALERYPQAVKSLEEALTNFHELVQTLTPPDEINIDHGAVPGE